MIQTSLSSNASMILSEAAIERKMLRMAYEIYERNAPEKDIILAGITDRGSTVTRALKNKLENITPLKLDLLEIQLDKSQPLNATLKGNPDCNDKCVIVVDDVANSGRTLFYAMRPFMDMLPKQIQTAVLVDRMHKSFPVSIDYTGYHLSTTLQEKVIVNISDNEIKGAYLD